MAFVDFRWAGWVSCSPEGGSLQPRSSFEASQPADAAEVSRDSEAPSTSVSVEPMPFGGPFFARLLALYIAGFLSTSCIILGAWFLVMKPAQPAGAPQPPSAEAAP